MPRSKAIPLEGVLDAPRRYHDNYEEDNEPGEYAYAQPNAQLPDGRNIRVAGGFKSYSEFAFESLKDPRYYASVYKTQAPKPTARRKVSEKRVRAVTV
jgi:hypothetical protein